MFVVNWFKSMLSYFGFANKKAKIAFLGLDNAGKSTLLHVLKDDKLIAIEPTRHPQFEELQIGNIRLKTFDLGGHLAARRLWEQYFPQVDAIVFIVDSTDIKRLPEAKEELTKLLTSEDLSKLPFLILGNKIDAKGAMSEAQLKSALGLQNTSGKVLGKVPEGVQPLELFMCSVYKRAGYPDGFRWLSENLK